MAKSILCAPQDLSPCTGISFDHRSRCMEMIVTAASKQTACPICEHVPGAYRRKLDEKYSVLKCPDCGLEYVYPMPDEEELRDFYSNYRDIRAHREVVEQNSRLHLELLKKYGWGEQEPTLDFGCGPGAFVRIAKDACFGVELLAGSRDRIVSNLHELPERLWSFVTLWGVLEHLADPVNTLRKLSGLQAPGGILALTTVDAEGPIPYHYKPPEHLTYWTRAALGILAEKCGYQVLDVHPYQMVQFSKVYLDRLLARTPEQYRDKIRASLPELITVPTNEFRAVLRRKE